MDKNIPKNKKGFNQLPETIQKKISPKLAAEYRRGGRVKLKDGSKKLCPKGKAAAKRKFAVYPSEYANMYASAVCSGKVKPGGKKKKASGGRVSFGSGGAAKRGRGCEIR